MHIFDYTKTYSSYETRNTYFISMVAFLALSFSMSESFSQMKTVDSFCFLHCFSMCSSKAFGKKRTALRVDLNFTCRYVVLQDAAAKHNVTQRNVRKSVCYTFNIIVQYLCLQNVNFQNINITKLYLLLNLKLVKVKFSKM